MLKRARHALLFLLISVRASFPATVNQSPIDYCKTQQAYYRSYEDASAPLKFIFRELGRVVHCNREDISAGATIIIAIFTIVLGVFTISLARSTRIAAKAAEKALTELERPWLFLSSVSIRIRERAPPGQPILFNRWFAKLHWKNIGRSPAFVVKCTFTIVDKASLPVKPVFDEQHTLSV